MQNVLIYGGSFDPIHNGHLKTALSIQNDFQFQRFIFVPCKTPLLKMHATASAEQRVCMLQLALHDYPQFEIDMREINRETPSYMVDTLGSYRTELGDATSMTLLLGDDAFHQLSKWHRWETLISLCNLLVMIRPEVKTTPPAELRKMLVTRTTNATDLLNTPYGKLMQYNAGEFAISSTWVRSQIQHGRQISEYVPLSVGNYIKEQGLYQTLV